MRPCLTWACFNEQENHQSPVPARVLHIHWNGPHEHMDMDDGSDYDGLGVR